MPELAKPTLVRVVAETEKRIFVASQWQLMWWRFRKHILAMVGTVILIAFYGAALTAEFLAIQDPEASRARDSLMPPQSIHLFDQGKFDPFIFAVIGTRDPNTYRRVYQVDGDTKIHVRLLATGFAYKLFGLIPTDRHLVGFESAGTGQETLYPLGTDELGRDQWSRLVFASRTSLLIGLVSVALSLVLGVLLGGLSGYYGGFMDTGIQRVIEILRSIPTIPLWMGLAAAVPRDWSVERVYFVITIIISLIGWTELARVVRGRFLSLREEEFVMAAQLSGCSKPRVIFRHMVPSFLSHIIAATTLALPAMIISETTLSFLGLGLRPPAISWGVLLQQAQNVQTVALSPWLLLPAIPVTLAILAFNFMGDGLRDAADPYGV
jgi:peptide/nickel transport system permease protein